MRISFGCIVEGHGEESALPILIQRIARQVVPSAVVHVLPPVRVSRDSLTRQDERRDQDLRRGRVQPDELERAVERVARRVGSGGVLLVLLDSDDDCPASLGPQLLGRARIARSDMLLGVVLACREYEAWFLAAAPSLRGLRGLPQDLDAPPNPEGIRGTKEWLSRHMPKGFSYRETLHQEEFTRAFDMDLALRAPSFDKCYREIARLLIQAQERTGG